LAFGLNQKNKDVNINIIIGNIKFLNIGELMFISDSGYKIKFGVRCCLSKRPISMNLLGSLCTQDINFYMINDEKTMNPFGSVYDFSKSVESTDFDFIVLLEDDSIINHHLKLNIDRLVSRFEKDLSKLNLVFLSVDSHNDYSIGSTYNHKFNMYSRTEKMHYSAGILLSKKFLMEFSNHIQEIDLFSKKRNFDLEISEFCVKEHGCFFVTRPSIVATDKSIASSLGNSYKPKDNQFSADHIFI
jgi:hypothetical protein